MAVGNGTGTSTALPLPPDDDEPHTPMPFPTLIRRLPLSLQRAYWIAIRSPMLAKLRARSAALAIEDALLAGC